MATTIKRKKQPTDFGSIELGQAFLNSRGVLRIKVKNMDSCNCICPVNGDVYKYSSSDHVVPVDLEIEIL